MIKINIYKSSANFNQSGHLPIGSKLLAIFHKHNLSGFLRYLLTGDSFDKMPNKRLKDCLWKQRTHYRLENQSLGFIETLHKQKMFEKRRNSTMKNLTEKKKNTGQLIFHEQCIQKCM